MAPKRLRCGCLLIAGLGLAACQSSAPFLLHGDPNTVAIGYAGNPDATAPLAKEFCAQFERRPRLKSTELDVVYYDCVRP